MVLRHIIFRQRFNMWNITNMHQNFFNYHWTRKQTRRFEIRLISKRRESFCLCSVITEKLLAHNSVVLYHSDASYLNCLSLCIFNCLIITLQKSQKKWNKNKNSINAVVAGNLYFLTVGMTSLKYEGDVMCEPGQGLWQTGCQTSISGSGHHRM